MFAAVDEGDPVEDDDAMSDSTLVSESARSGSSDGEEPINMIDESFSELLDQTSFSAFCENSHNPRHHILSPIFEENEDAVSVISSALPQQSDLDKVSDSNHSAKRQTSLQSASYDSLASFEANEKLMMMIDGNPRGDLKTKGLNNTASGKQKQADAEEQDILNYAMRRQKNPFIYSPVGSPINSHTFFLSDTSQFTGSDSQMSNISNLTSTLFSTEDIDRMSMKTCSNNHTVNLSVSNEPLTDFINNNNSASNTQRTLSLHSLERNDPSKNKEPVIINYSTDDKVLDAFEDRVIGYLAQRQRGDSIFDFDLSSLHKEITSKSENTVKFIDGKNEREDRLQMPSVCDNVEQGEKTLKTETRIPENSEIVEEAFAKKRIRKNSDCEDKRKEASISSESTTDQHSELSSPESLSSCNQEFTDGNANKKMPSLCNFNDSAFETVSSCESDFHSCASSISTNIPYEVANVQLATDVLSDPGYKTPPESNDNYETPVELDSNDSGTAVLSSVKSALSPLTTTVTSGATGYQTPPKWYYVIPPKFIGSKAENVSVFRGGTAVLECSIVSHPEAKVAWYKDGRLLEIYDRISQHTSNQPPVRLAREYVESSSWSAPPLLPTETDIDIGCVPQLDVHYLLKIKNAMSKDEGSYVCKAWNSAGVATRIIRLTVSNRVF